MAGKRKEKEFQHAKQIDKLRIAVPVNNSGTYSLLR